MMKRYHHEIPSKNTCNSWAYWLIFFRHRAILVNGGDLVSTWVAKLEGHVEEVTNLVKKVAKL
jgi:hypothetical protein